jgi:mono/diheme cytochrome c family protein
MQITGMQLNRKTCAALVGCALFLSTAVAAAQDFSPERIRAGAALFSRNCSPCHGTRMRDPEAAFDLRTFPPEQHERFVNSVTHGKNQMPPWGDLIKPDEIESLWAYVMKGEPK